MTSHTLDAGRLRHRITLQSFVSERDSNGVLTEGWVTFATVWAAIEPLSAREFIESGAQQAKITARITIRHREDVIPSMRALHRSKVYNIEGVLADKDSGLEYLTLPVSAGVNEGQ